MQEIMNLEGINNGKDFEWTSKDIAEWADKRHDNIIRDIRNEIKSLKEDGMEEFGTLNFEESSYKQVSGKPYPIFRLTKLGVQQLCMRYSASIRAKVNMKLEELSKKTSPSYQIEDPILRAEKWIEEQKENKAKVDTYDKVIELKYTYNFRTVAGAIGMTQTELIDYLIRKGLIYRKPRTQKTDRVGVLMPKSPYYAEPYRYVVTRYSHPDEDRNVHQARLTFDGVKYLCTALELNLKDVVSLMEKDN